MTKQVMNESQQRMHSKIDKVQQGLDEVNSRMKEIFSKTTTLTHMAKATPEKLDKSTATTCKAVFEATEVILRYEYGTAKEEGSVAVEYAEKMATLGEYREMAAQVARNPVESVISLKGTVNSVEAADKTMDKLSWFVGKVSTVASNPLQAAQDIVQEELKKIADSYTGKTLYFYLIDEITGEPIESDLYPVEITTSSALVPEQRNIGVVGEGGRRHNTLDKESSVAEFDVLQGVIDYGNEDKQTKRGAELRGAAEADGLLRQARQRVKRHAEGVRGRLKRSVDDTGGREGDAEREHAGADSGERRGYGEELKRQLGATVETPPPQPGLQAEVDELKRKLQSVETQDEPRLRAEVDD